MMTVHEAQTAILAWIWENDGLVCDREALDMALADDGPWRITITGLEYLDSLADKRIVDEIK